MFKFANMFSFPLCKDIVPKYMECVPFSPILVILCKIFLFTSLDVTHMDMGISILFF